MRLEDLYKLAEIIALNGLDRPDKQYIPGVDNIRLLENLVDCFDEESRFLAFLLIEKYDVVMEYRPYAMSILRKLAERHDGKVCIFPVLPPGKTDIKSGSVMLYELRSISHVFPEKFLFFDVPDSPELLVSREPKYAVDDFIGTGDQFFEMMDAIKPKHKPAVTGVAAIAMMESAKNSLEKSGFCVDAEILKKKAISGYLRDEGHDEARLFSIYDRIESRLRLDHSFKRGYGNSEALISMKRTPDNTLPIFWNNGSDGKWPAPFTR